MALSLDGTTGISATGNIISSGGIISATGNIYGGNIIGTIAPAAITVSGNATVGNLLTAGFVSATGNILAGNIIVVGGFYDTGDHLVTSTAANANIVLTPTGTGITQNNGAFSASGNVTGGNVLTAGIMSSTGNATHGNILTGGLVSATGNVTGNYLLGNGTFITGLSASKIFNGTSEANIGTSGGNANITIGGTSNVFVVATTGIYTTGLSSVTGNITAGNLLTAGIMSSTGNAIHGNMTVSTGTITVGNIVNANGNAVGNIGSSSAYFNTIFGKATTAQYADVAELYSTEAEYTPGTVLVFGGNQEVTISTVSADPRVAGVVSTNPAYLMNSTLDSEHKVAVALTGRVPTRVTGTVRKGDMMVTANNGHAQACATPAMGTVIGKALEHFDGVSGVIEVVVGRL